MLHPDTVWNVFNYFDLITGQFRCSRFIASLSYIIRGVCHVGLTDKAKTVGFLIIISAWFVIHQFCGFVFPPIIRLLSLSLSTMWIVADCGWVWPGLSLEYNWSATRLAWMWPVFVACLHHYLHCFRFHRQLHTTGCTDDVALAGVESSGPN